MIMIMIIIAKLFYLGGKPQEDNTAYIHSSVQHLQRLLGVDTIDTFIVSLGEADVSSAWKQLELLHQQNILNKLGVADFSQEQLESILSNSSITVKPSVNQINVTQCCSMPSAMIDLARKHHVELLHNVDQAGKFKKNNK